MSDHARPVDPVILSSVRDSWGRIDAWLARNAPDLVLLMRDGATPEAVADAEKALGVEFPDAVRASYAIHDGSEIMSLFPSGDYLPLAEMLFQYAAWKQLVEEGDFDGIEHEPEGPIRRDHYHLKWIPLTHNGGGDHTLIDLAPAEGGLVGQLIEFDHETGPELVSATGLDDYLSYVADELEAGSVKVDEDGGLDWD